MKLGQRGPFWTITILNHAKGHYVAHFHNNGKGKMEYCETKLWMEGEEFVLETEEQRTNRHETATNMGFKPDDDYYCVIIPEIQKLIDEAINRFNAIQFILDLQTLVY